MKTRSGLLLTIAGLLLAVAPATAGTLYSNGSYGFDQYGWPINFNQSVSDSFTVPSGSSIEGLQFVYWDSSSVDLLTTVDMSMGTLPFGTDISPRQTLSSVTNTFIGTNGFGYSVIEAEYAFSNIAWSGAGWVTLSNACTSISACSQPGGATIGWDQNGGASEAFSLTGTNGSSKTYEGTMGSIPSESFTLTGTSGGTTPEPSSIILLGSGILGLAGILRRKLNS